MSETRKTHFIACSLSVCCFLLILSPTSLVFAAEDEFDELQTLDFKIDGTYEEEAAVFRYRYKNIGSDEEAFRLDVTTESGQRMGVILDKGDNKVFFKEMEASNWQILPSMMLTQWWKQWREPHLGGNQGATFWRNIEGEKYVIEDEDQTVTIYEVVVDKPIEDSVFSP